MKKAEQIVASIAIEDDLRSEVICGIGEQRVDGRQKRSAARTRKTGRGADLGIETRRIVNPFGIFCTQVLSQKTGIVPLVAASVCCRERDAGERLLRPRKRGADEGRVDAARHRH